MLLQCHEIPLKVYVRTQVDRFFDIENFGDVLKDVSNRAETWDPQNYYSETLQMRQNIIDSKTDDMYSYVKVINGVLVNNLNVERRRSSS